MKNAGDGKERFWITMRQNPHTLKQYVVVLSNWNKNSQTKLLEYSSETLGIRIVFHAWRLNEMKKKTREITA